MADPSPAPTESRSPLEQHRHTMRTVRWVIMGVGLAVGLALVLNGNVVAGVLIGGFAAFRMAMMLYVSRRQHQLVTSWRGGQGAPPASGSFAGLGAGRRGRAQGGQFPRLAERELTVAATTIGMDPGELRQAIGQGQSIAQLAVARNVSPARVVDAIIADASAMLDQASARGRLPVTRQGQARARLPEWADRMVNQAGSTSR